MSDTTKLIIGLAALACLLLATNAIKNQAIQTELQEGAISTLTQADVDWAEVSVEGRNAVVSGIAPSQDAGEAAVDLVSGQFGIHSAKGDFRVVEVVSPFLWTGSYGTAGLTLAGVVPSQEAMDALLMAAKGNFPDAQIRNEMRIAGGAPEGDWTATAKAGLTQLARLKTGRARLLDNALTLSGETDTSSTLDAITRSFAAVTDGFEAQTDIVVSVPDVTPELPNPVSGDQESDPQPVIIPAEAQIEIDRCQSAIDGIMSGQTIKFRTGSAEVVPQPNPLIVRLAAVTKECPNTRVVISGHTDSVGDKEANQVLSQARAQAVVNLLVDESVAADRLQAEGFGSTKPIAANTTPEGRSANRRIEFQVLYAGASQ
ncbi:MAG: OmpA family protein [Pseudomonadota bacterium]